MRTQKETDSLLTTEQLRALVLAIFSEGYNRFGARMPLSVDKEISHAGEEELRGIWGKIKSGVRHQEIVIQPRLPRFH